MFFLKKEYPELDMSKLEAGVSVYMYEQNMGSGETKPLPQTIIDVALLQSTTDVAPPQISIDTAPSGAEKPHGAKADLPAKAP